MLVVFFNFVPQAIGPAHAKFETATEEVHAVARARVLRILLERKPDAVVVFSSKGWDAFPHYPKEGPILVSAPAIRSWGVYTDADGHSVAAFGLAHPQGANSRGMSDAVSAILDRAVTG